jgi:5-methylcytosine-specific restriction protein A
MPYKSKKACGYPGCPELTNSRYCDKHQQESDHIYNKYKRDPMTKKRYGRSWKHIRDRFIKTHPLCEECRMAGKLTLAEEVHHILPLTKGGSHSDDNLMSLCKSCHSTITAKSGCWG